MGTVCERFGDVLLFVSFSIEIEQISTRPQLLARPQLLVIIYILAYESIFGYEYFVRDVTVVIGFLLKICMNFLISVKTRL